METKQVNKECELSALVDCKYQFLKKIGKGLTAEVWLVKDIEDGSLCALKLFTKPTFYMQETSVLEKLSLAKNQAITNIVKSYPKVDITLPGDKTSKLSCAIVLQYAQNGEIFDYFVSGKGFPDKISRYYFHAIIEALEFIHSEGLVHRDIKPENILLDTEFKVKLADFGFARSVKKAKDHSEKLNSYVGTKSYMAPELLLKKQYQGDEIDLFAAGVLLFIFFAGRPPFNMSHPHDLIYKHIAVKEYGLFWERQNKCSGGKIIFPEDFRDLINRICAFESPDRIKLSEIKEHKWYIGEVATDEEVKVFMEERRIEVLKS